MTIEGLEEMLQKLEELKSEKDFCERCISVCLDVNERERLSKKLEDIKWDIMFYESELDID